MKIIFLNVWHGKRERELSDFLSAHVRDTDIFCFQESEHRDGSLRNVGEPVLSGYARVSAKKHSLPDERFELATYVRAGLSSDTKTLLLDIPTVGLCLHTKITVGENILHVFNMHGRARPGDKLDNADRLMQFRTIHAYATNAPGLHIIGGDLNVHPDTQSLQMFRDAGYRDLIKEFHISTTRNELAWRAYPVKMLYSDYVFVSPSVHVSKFEVPNLLVSDHLPMCVEFHAV